MLWTSRTCCAWRSALNDPEQSLVASPTQGRQLVCSAYRSYHPLHSLWQLASSYRSLLSTFSMGVPAFYSERSDCGTLKSSRHTLHFTCFEKDLGVQLRKAVQSIPSLARWRRLLKNSFERRDRSLPPASRIFTNCTRTVMTTISSVNMLSIKAISSVLCS